MEADVCRRNRRYQLPASSEALGVTRWQEECTTRQRKQNHDEHRPYGHQVGFWCDEAEVYRKTWWNRTPMSGLQQLFLRELWHATFEISEIKFNFTRRSTCAPALHILWNVEKEWEKRQIVFSIEQNQGGCHEMYSFLWANNYWITSHAKKLLDHMMKELIKEAARWDLEQQWASLWWSSTYADDVKEDMMIKTKKELNKFPFEKCIEILGYIFNQSGKSHESLEERMPKANRTWRGDAKIFRSKDVPCDGVLYNDSENGKDDLKHCSDHSYRKSLPKACGEPWDGYGTKGPIQFQSIKEVSECVEVGRPASDPKQSTKRDDRTLFSNQCQKVTQDSLAQLSVFFFSSNLFPL